MIQPIDDEARAELMRVMQYATGVGDGYIGPHGKLTIGQCVVALDARCTAAEKALAELLAGEPVEIHAETLIAVAAWCASEGSDDIATAAAEVRAFVAACSDIGRRGGESLARAMAAAVPTDGELVCRHCGTPWGQRHSETCINVPAPVATRHAEPEATGPDDPADLNPEPMNAPHLDSVRNENGSHR